MDKTETSESPKRGLKAQVPCRCRRCNTGTSTAAGYMQLIHVLIRGTQPIDGYLRQGPDTAAFPSFML